MLQVYFDFDDTLVKTQVLFEESKRDCAHLIQQANPALSFEEIIGTFNAREAQNIKEHGLLSSRFGLSWTETYAHFLGSNEAEQAAIASLAMAVYDKKTNPIYGAKKTLETLRRKGYDLTMITAGETTTQKQRVERSSFEPYFKEIFVVLEKTPAVMQSIVGSRPSDAVMIGNSLNSDIHPSLTIGMHAILVKGDTWMYDQAAVPTTEKFYQGTIRTVPDIISRIEKSGVDNLASVV